MRQVYRIPSERLLLEKRRIGIAMVALLVIVPAMAGLAALVFRLDTSGITARYILTNLFMVGVSCAALWFHTLMQHSLQIELEDDRITRSQDRPFRRTPLYVSFGREDVSQIREVRNSGLMIRGRTGNGRYIDLHVPRLIQGYEDLRARLGTWQPIRDSWF